MAQEIFQRYEKKYLLTKEQYLDLMCELVKWMYADDYGQHTISNIYFDTDNYELIRQSIQKPAYKEKVRMRGYGKIDDNSTVFIELKKKFAGIVYKRRVSMTRAEARTYLQDGVWPEGGNRQILKEIDYTIGRYQLKPKVYLAYDRMAFVGKENSDLRVTFDRNIRCRDWDVSLLPGQMNVPLLEDEQVLMEVKIPGAMPMWMCKVFSQCKIYPVSFSKYGTYYQRYLYQDVETEAVMLKQEYAVNGGKFSYA